jgi:hypothetical protein
MTVATSPKLLGLGIGLVFLGCFGRVAKHLHQGQHLVEMYPTVLYLDKDEVESV